MLRLHRLNDQEVLINAELIETVEAQGRQTVIRLTTGNSFIVRETVEAVVSQNADYRRAVFAERRPV